MRRGRITITGEHRILDKMRNMISESKSRVYLSVSGNILPDLLTEIQVAHQRGIKMVVITDTPFPQEGMTVHVLEAEEASTDHRGLHDRFDG